MTFLSGRTIAPQVGGCYQLRAGLTAIVTEMLPIQGLLFWRGVILEDGSRCIWYGNGQYSPARDVSNELDICELIG